MSSPSDAPVRTSGLRTRSGNAMLRTRAAILDGTARCIEHRGVRKTTMSDVSSQAKVAKATLYNHFRTKDDLLDALVLSLIEQLAAECAELAGAGLAPALEHAGRSIGSLAPLRRVAADEPAVLAVLGAPAQGRSWDAARRGLQTVLRESGAPSDAVSVDVVLRWLCGHVMWPATEAELVLGARLLTAGLGRAPALEAAVEPASDDDPRPAVAGIGWPS
ncbi:MAG: TetR/AcrR family transcriptional regulator [Frankiaceae bacterium]|nr:TetR/AcrR family transcriptional regulator [Frankiaceae bacterium]